MTIWELPDGVRNPDSGKPSVFTQNDDMQPLSATIFWPKGCKVDGVCYGWLKPSICIAGVVEVSLILWDFVMYLNQLI